MRLLVEAVELLRARYSQKRGKTPVLGADEARGLLDSIDTTSLRGLRDRR